MRVGTIRERLLQRVGEVLVEGNSDDVLLVADQLRIVAGALAHYGAEDDVELGSLTVDTAQASRMLSYHAEHVRRLIRQGTMHATKVGADYRIPLLELFNTLVRRHHDEELPELLPTLRPGIVNAPSLRDDFEVSIDVALLRRGERHGVKRFTIDVAELMRVPPPVNGDMLSGQPNA